MRTKAFFASLFGARDAAPAEDPRDWVADGAMLLDVRTPGEFASGHLPGATNIPVQVLADRLDAIASPKVVVYCASGIRSRRARRMLEGHGKAVLDIGSIRGWPRDPTPPDRSAAPHQDGSEA